MQDENKIVILDPIRKTFKIKKYQIQSNISCDIKQFVNTIHIRDLGKAT